MWYIKIEHYYLVQRIYFDEYKCFNMIKNRQEFTGGKNGGSGVIE